MPPDGTGIGGTPLPSSSSPSLPHVDDDDQNNTPEVQPQADDAHDDDLNRSRTPLKPKTVHFDDFEDRQPATPPQSTKRQEPSTPTSPVPTPAIKKSKDEDPESPKPDPTSSSSTGPTPPLADSSHDEAGPGRVQSGEPRDSSQPEPQDETIEYDDPE